MYYREHEPAHFHARYGEYEAQVAISTLEMMDGFLPSHALSLVCEWGEIHRAELQDNWIKARAHQPLDTIDPLP
jgi:hypothetical protein